MICPSCGFEYTYEEGNMYVCSACQFKWEIPSDEVFALDANGNKLVDGDNAVVIKDLKVKGASKVLKMGTKVTNIKIVEGDHNIDCRIDGFGKMELKSEFLKKVN
ncbi:MAG TPA: zinc ribbon domain-containing protein YjdM [Bacilli bacterium]|nr:zinc ribbon domain-containing protein YjdM [Bacilli bacterium]